tara:strand:- start:3698 stop:4117 length:420 start_codon:yes stop_codon:yes gene_type:complete
MENKEYYTPNIEDFFIGYECEVNWSSGYSKEFTPFIFTLKNKEGVYTNNYNDALIAYDDGYAEFRTKFLCKQDIIDLSFKYSEQHNAFFKDKYKIAFTQNQSVLIGLVKNHNPRVIFEGKCKSKNELKKLLKDYLNIPI